jgi:hypothetical protein
MGWECGRTRVLASLGVFCSRAVLDGGLHPFSHTPHNKTLFTVSNIIYCMNTPL